MAGAAYIFHNISQLKEHVGGGANVNLELSAIKPTILYVYQQHIRQWLGDDQWDALVAVADTGASAAQTALLDKLRAPVGMLTMYEYSKIGNVYMGENGMYRVETEERKTAYKYQENEWRDYMQRNGWEALEMLLDFLEDNEDDYPLWQAYTTGYARNKALFINRADDFRNAYSYGIDRYTFEMLRGMMQDVETFAILPILGEDQYADLKEGIALKSLTSAERTLIGIIQRAVAHFTIELASVRNWVTIKGNAIVQLEKLEPQGLSREGTASGQSVSALLSQVNLLANRHISYMKHYLSENLSTFTLYSDYLDALAEAEAAETAASSTAPSFEDERYSGAYNYSTPASTKRTGIIRL